jgi:DNA topoisomerase 2-associated protein PAT1
MSKFDSVVDTAQLHRTAAAAIGREIPVELLCASLPHTNEDERKHLLNFSQCAVPVSSNSSHGSGTGPMTSDSVPT